MGILSVRLYPSFWLFGEHRVLLFLTRTEKVLIRLHRLTCTFVENICPGKGYLLTCKPGTDKKINQDSAVINIIMEHLTSMGVFHVLAYFTTSLFYMLTIADSPIETIVIALCCPNTLLDTPQFLWDLTLLHSNELIWPSWVQYLK